MQNTVATHSAMSKIYKESKKKKITYDELQK